MSSKGGAPDVFGPDGDPGPDPGPRWPFGDEVASALLGLLEVELRRRRRRWRMVARDQLEVVRVGVPWPGQRVDVRPLRERMDELPKADWPELVEQYVSELGFERLAWREASSPLRARVLAADPAGVASGATLQREVADGLVEAVVTESAPRPGVGVWPQAGGELVALSDAVGWGVPEDTVFEAARENVRAAGRLEAERFSVDGTALTALFGHTHYAATHVFWLREYLAGHAGWDESNGALVAVPHRHLIAVHVIESAAVVAAAGTLLRFAARQFETCPGPISDQLYWWQDGALCRLPSDSVGETLHLFPSSRFADLLDRLRAA